MRTALLILCVVSGAGCAKKAVMNRSESMGDRLTELPPVDDVPVRGHTVTVVARARNVTGELLGLDASSVWVLEDVESNRARPVAIPRREVDSVGVVAYDANVPTTAAWAAAGTVSTISHGFFFLFSVPVWMTVGIGTSIDEGFSNDIELDRADIDVLSQYARFPQGMSVELLRALVEPPRRPRRP